MKQRSVAASLEGMRVVVEDGICRLEEYDFVKNAYFEIDAQPWPLSGIVASDWLAGWNAFDRRLATSLLQGNADEVGL
jgi:hypothetical protein